VMILYAIRNPFTLLLFDAVGPASFSDQELTRIVSTQFSDHGC